MWSLLGAIPPHMRPKEFMWSLLGTKSTPKGPYWPGTAYPRIGQGWPAGRPGGRSFGFCSFVPKLPKKGPQGPGGPWGLYVALFGVIFCLFLCPGGGAGCPIFLILGCCAVGSTSGAVYMSFQDDLARNHWTMLRTMGVSLIPQGIRWERSSGCDPGGLRLLGRPG